MNLSPDDLLSCLGRGEGSRLEFKRRLPREERAARTLCAFANTSGGLLLVGVTDAGRVHGVHHPDEVCTKLSELTLEWLRPALRVQLQVVEVNGPRVVACRVPFSKERPHAVLFPDGTTEFVVRVGASNRVADGPTLRALELDKRSRKGVTPLEQSILAWVAKQAPNAAHPAGRATVARFGHAHNVGEARARRAFVRLESLGLLIGHGAGRARLYSVP
ncbi:MAG: ATP-binding protein [Planctomycetota bacterium]